MAGTEVHKYFFRKIDKLLLLIIFLGVLLRFAGLSKYPVGLNPQEALIGYRVGLLIQSGRDETGRKWPLIFSSFTDYQMPLSTYVVVPSVRLFGLNEFSVRFPFAIFGVFLITGVYRLARALFSDKPVLAYWSALLTAISPVTIFISRISLPEVVALSFATWGICFLIKKENRINSLVSAIFFTGSIYATKTAWFFVAIFFLLMVLGYKKISYKRFFMIFLLIFLFSLPILVNFFGFKSFSQSLRENDLSFFGDISILNNINKMRGESLTGGNSILGKLFYNKSYFILLLIENFLKHFNPRFYFSFGDQNSLHGLSNFGPIYLVLLSVFLIGIFDMVKSRAKNGMFLAIWFVAATIPSTLSIKNPDVFKSIFIFPVLIIVTSWGILKLSRKTILLVFIPLLIFNLLFVFYDGLIKEPSRSLSEWPANIEPLVGMIWNQYQNFDKVYFTDAYVQDPGPLFLFYLSKQKILFETDLLSNGFKYHNWINKFGKIHIGEIANFKFDPGQKILLIITPEERNYFASRYGNFYFGGKIVKDLCYKIVERECVRNINSKQVLAIASLEKINCQLTNKIE